MKKKETYEYFQEEIAGYISHEKILLDAGCGKSGINDLEAFRLKNKLCLGLDASFEALQTRTCFNYKTQGLIEALPFRNDCFDVIISHLVFEHLKDPKLAVKEFHRVLKPGGGIVITTNSIFHPLMFLSHILPLRARDSIKKNILHMHDDSFPTFYRFNSLGRIDRVMVQQGFKRRFSTYSSTPYSGGQISVVNRVLKKLLDVWNQLADVKWLRALKPNIVVHYLKKK